jgi:hypothetical protein
MKPTIETILLSEVIFDPLIYPRAEHSPAKVQEYAENLEAIEEKENFMHVSKRLALLDGRHRHLAYQKNAGDDDPFIKVYVHDVSGELDEIETAIELNASHGQILIESDKKNCAIRLYKDGAGRDKDYIQRKLSVSLRMVNKYLTAIDDEIRKNRKDKIMKMYLACHTEAEIATEVGKDQSTVNRELKVLCNLEPGSKLHNTANFYDEDFQLPVYNVWAFAKKSNEVVHFGNSEQRIVDNLLYLYTEPFDIVIDPFAGGGSTIDVCKPRMRRYWVSDRKPIVERAGEIRQLDIATDLPNLDKRWDDVSLTYLDPPYWRQAAGKYSKDAEDLANMPLDQFTKTLADVVKRIASKQSKGAIALLIQPTQWNADERQFTDHVTELISAVGNKKLVLENRVSCPYSTEQCNAQMVEWAKANKKLLVISRELIIWRLAK